MLIEITLLPEYSPYEEAANFAQQIGVFEVRRAERKKSTNSAPGGNVLRQVLLNEPIHWCPSGMLQPIALIGDYDWLVYAIRRCPYCRLWPLVSRLPSRIITLNHIDTVHFSYFIRTLFTCWWPSKCLWQIKKCPAFVSVHCNDLCTLGQALAAMPFVRTYILNWSSPHRNVIGVE